MLTIEEARRIQAKRQKTALTKFFVFLAVVLAVNIVGDILLVRFEADSRIIPLLAFLSVILLMALFFRLGMQNFFKKKEVTGIVLSTQADALPTHSSKSHLAGQRYKTVDQPVLQIVLREETGPEKSKEKTFFHECVLTEELKTLRDGERITLLRFIDQPIRLDPENVH